MVQIIKDSIARYMSMRNDTVASMLWAIRDSIERAASGKGKVDDKLAEDFERRLKIAEEMTLKIKTAYEIYEQINTIESNYEHQED